MKLCPNCNQPVGSSAFCPNCGADLRIKIPEKLLTHAAGVDIFLGIVIGLALIATFGVGLLVVPILWLTLRGSYASLARGFGISVLVVVALFLGAIALCFGAIFIAGMSSSW